MAGLVGQSRWLTWCLVAVMLLVWRGPASAISLDSDGDLKFGARSYVNARVGTEDTHQGTGTATSILNNGTFPYSPAGHLRQNRYFIELELKHDLTRLDEVAVLPQ